VSPGERSARSPIDLTTPDSPKGAIPLGDDEIIDSNSDGSKTPLSAPSTPYQSPARTHRVERPVPAAPRKAKRPREAIMGSCSDDGDEEHALAPVRLDSAFRKCWEDGEKQRVRSRRRSHHASTSSSTMDDFFASEVEGHNTEESSSDKILDLTEPGEWLRFPSNPPPRDQGGGSSSTKGRHTTTGCNSSETISRSINGKGKARQQTSENQASFKARESDSSSVVVLSDSD